MADNPADQETMDISARFIAEAIDIHRDHLRPEDVELYTRAHAELDAELSAGSAQLQERVNWLEKDLRLYSDADEISAEDKERLLHYTKRIIDDSLELSAARSEYAALGVLLKKGTKEGALEADQILNKGDLFAKLNISENLREWFGENILAPAVAKDFSDRKKFDQDMLKQVNSNIKTVERWNLAESDAHLSRYDAQIKFHRDNKNAAAVKEAEDRYNNLARKLQRQTRELFSDQVLNGARSRGELQVLYRLADKPSIGTQPAPEVSESPVTESEIVMPARPAPGEGSRQESQRPADTITRTADSSSTKDTIVTTQSGNDTSGTVTQTVETGTTTDSSIQTKDSDAKAGYETALQILHKKGLALNPDYNAEAAEPSLKSFVQYYLLFKPDDKIAPDDEEKLDGLILAAELYHRADGDFEKMTSNDLLEDVLFINPPKPTPPKTADAAQKGAAAGTTPEASDETAAEADNKENPALVKPIDIEAFNEKTKNLNYDALIKQMGEQAHDGKLPVMDILALLDEELNPEKGYDHKLAKENMREFIKATNGNPDREISLGDHNAVQNLARLAMAYKLANGDMKKVVALYGPGMDKEKATIDDSVSRFGSVLAKHHKADAPKADAPAMSVVPGGNSPESEDSWFDPKADVSWGRLGAIALGAVVLKKYLKSRSARRAAATPAATPAAQPAANAANNTAETPPAGETETAQGERPAQATDEEQARAARTQAGTEPEEATRNANGRSARRGQAQAVIDEGPSPEMDEVNRKLLKLQQRDLKHREKKLEELKYERRKLKEEFEKSPEKSENDKKLLKMLKKDIEKKQGKIDTLRREIYDTERALEGRPASRTTQQGERVVEPTRATQAERPVETVRTIETARPATDRENPPPRETGTTESRTAAQAPLEPESRSVITGSGEQAHTPADGQRGITQSQEPFEDYMTRRMEDDSAKNITEAKPVERTASVPETTAADTLNVLDDRDIPRPARFGPTMDAYNGRSLYERGSALDKEKSFLQAEREQLIHQPSNSKRWKKHEEREERYKKDRQELDKDWEGYKQRGEQLTTEGKQLKAREDALNKEFADFEKNKSKLGPQELEARGRELMTERVKLHADSMRHSEQLAHYQGAQFSLISDRPAGKNTARVNPEHPDPYADNTKNLAKAKKQLSKEYEKLEKESEKIEADEKKLKALKDKFTLPTDRPLTSSEEAKLKKIEDMQLEIDEKKARLKAREAALGEHSDIYTQASETHEQRQKDLDAEQKKLYEKQEDLEKRSRLLEREKTNLKPKDYIEKSRALALEQDNLHTERTNLEAKRAAHHGENYSHTSARPGDVLKPWQPATPFNDVKFGRGLGMGFGTWSLFGRTMTIEGRQDFRDQFSTAAVGATADLTGIVADGAEIRQATKISQAAQESKAAAKAVGNVRSLAALEEGLETTSKIAGKVKTGSKLATPVAVAATVVSGVADFELGRRKGDAGRAAGATGAAAGAVTGMATGAAIGAGIGVWFGGVGAVPGAAIGIAAGAGLGFAGAVYGEKAGRMALTGTFSKWFGIDDALTRAGEGGVEMEVAKHYDLNKDGMLSLDEIKKGLEKNGIHSLSEMDTNRDGLTNEELRTALRRGLEASQNVAKDHFAGVAAPSPDPTLVGPGGVKIEQPGQKK
jgi:hypothetical protein